MSRVSRFASHLGVLPCQILDSASLTILYVHKHVRPGFWILTVETTDISLCKAPVVDETMLILSIDRG